MRHKLNNLHFDNTIVPREETSTSLLLKEINDSCKRFCYKDGYYSRAEFTLGDADFTYFKDGSLIKNSEATGRYEVALSTARNGKYRSYFLTSSNKRYNIMDYILQMICFTDGFYDLYMSDKSLIVNHMVIHNSYYASASNLDDLEVITIKENNRHAKFIKDYSLYGVAISAKDIDDIQSLFNYVYRHYKNTLGNDVEVVLDYKELANVHYVLSDKNNGDYSEKNFIFNGVSSLIVVTNLEKMLVKYSVEKVGSRVPVSNFPIAVIYDIPKELQSKAFGYNVSDLTTEERIRRLYFDSNIK